MNPNYPDNNPQQPQPQPAAQPVVPPVQSTGYSEPYQPFATQQQPAAPQYQQDPYLAEPTQVSYSAPVEQPNAFVSQPTVTKKKKPMTLIIIIAAAVLVLALAGGAVYAWQSGLFGGAATEEITEAPAPTPQANYDTPEAVETEIGSIQEALDAIDDSQLADDTISDQALNQ